MGSATRVQRQFELLIVFSDCLEDVRAMPSFMMLSMSSLVATPYASHSKVSLRCRTIIGSAAAHRFEQLNGLVDHRQQYPVAYEPEHF